MLLKMIPEAISTTWGDIKEQIERALPEHEQTEKTMTNLLEMLLLGKADCWTSYDAEDNNKINFIVVTMPVYNELTGEKNLLIYNVTNSVIMDLKTSNRLWIEGFQALQKYMKANGFSRLVSYFDDTNNRSFKIAKRFGADIKYYIEIGVMEG